MADLSFKVTGSNRAYILGKRLKAVGDKELEKELRRGITRSIRPGLTAVRQGLPTYLPSGYVPVLKPALQLKTSNVGAGLRITGQAKGNPRPRKVTAINKGVLRHPLFGNRNHWYAQPVRPRFFDEPLAQQAPLVRAELDKVLAEVAAKITAG